jgi:antitoxin (DNA-binding transcriptional repressor) of toxin-antitoxin stability system
MITVGAFEAKTHLSSLLDRVAEGEEVSSPSTESRSPGW